LRKTINILSAVDLLSIALWIVSLVAARILQKDVFSVIFLWIYIAALLIVFAFTVSSVLLFLLKKVKSYSKPCFYTAWVINIIWIVIFIAVIKNMTVMGSPLF